jgi:hypothetical protein
MNLLKDQYLIRFFFKVKIKIINIKLIKLNEFKNIIIKNKTYINTVNRTKNNIGIKKKRKIILLSKIQYLFSPLKKNIRIKKFNNEISKKKLL